MTEPNTQTLQAVQTSSEDRLIGLRQMSSCQTVRGIELWQYTPNDLLKFWSEHTNEIEPELFDWFDTFEPGSVYFDMGASSGVFAVYAAMKSKVDVFAFEPDAQNYSTADTNVFLNKRNGSDFNLRLFNVAISDQTKVENMYVRRYNAGAHNKILGVAELRDTAEEFSPEHVQSIVCFSLDDLLSILALPAPKYLKIDVDGSEMDVLTGGQQTLSSGSVKEIFTEIFDPDSRSEGKDILQRLNDFGFKEKERFPVKHMRGGYYPDLYNVILGWEG